METELVENIYWAVHTFLLQFQTWSFSPLAEETYSLKPILCFWPIQTDGRDKSQLTLTVVGMGSEGFIEVALSCFFVF